MCTFDFKEKLSLQTTVWKSRQKHDHSFLREYQHFFRQINVFTRYLDKEVTQNLVSRKFFKRDHVLLYFSTFVHTRLTSLSISRKIEK